MLFKIINIIKLNYIFKKKYFKTHLSLKELAFLKKLINFNIIKYIKKLDNNMYIVFIQYYGNKVLWVIENKIGYNNKFYINTKTIKNLTIKNNKIFLLTTNQGILSNIEALRKNVGGLIICDILLNTQ